MASKTPRQPDFSAWRVPHGGKGFALERLDPGAKPCSLGSKAEDKARVEALSREIDELQDLFWACRRLKLLVLLQGTDTSGKDGTIRAVFKETSPLGVRAVSWKAPTATERAHDFLWRIHQQVPQAGEFMIHNRSHYEDVLVPVVQGHLDAKATAQRLRQINDFERMLSETGTVILKFMLHISFEEQRKRLQERVDNPHKHWKFSMDDIDARAQWPQYQQAYDRMLAATSTRWAPWVVVPADSKTHRNLMVATVVRDKLRSLKLRYPPDDARLAGLVIT
ncbi:MAG: polyphosphate--nucleotide phosphotransferase [Pseudomonadota bacterium]|nr:polyphosphate--nucleotide phosphotransferase [Pseudomonadota bacterium]